MSEPARIVVKAVDGGIGRGIGVLITDSADVPDAAPFGGPYLVQDRVVSDGHDRKLYVAGAQVRGLLKSWLARTRSTPLAVDPALETLAIQAGKALGLNIYGVDILLGPDGPVIVDVNPFPGFWGVADGAKIVAAHLAGIAVHGR